MSTGPIDRRWAEHDRKRFAQGALVASNEDRYWNDPVYRRTIDQTTRLALLIADTALTDPEAAAQILASFELPESVQRAHTHEAMLRSRAAPDDLVLRIIPGAH